MGSNPFIISGYISPDYFCNREKEREMVTGAILNRRHLTIFSPRRIGKTGLIHHTFYYGMRDNLYIPVYADIMATTSVGEFVEALGKALFSVIARSETAMKKILKKLASLRPQITIDSLTGTPAVTLSIASEKEAVSSMEIIFNYISAQKRHFALAIDEFQQITDYKEKNIEALLRSFIQQTQNVTVIFSGSRKHILTGIFSHPERPFYNSTQIMEIGKIPEAEYSLFIHKRFSGRTRTITPEAIDLIFEITSLHTFYVQYMCNRLYSSYKKVDIGQVKEMLLNIINENEPVYAGYINLITPLQFRVLRAIAINDGVRNPTAGDFLNKYVLGAASSVSQAMKSLEEKGFISLNEDIFSLNDVFFRHWLIYKAG